MPLPHFGRHSCTWLHTPPAPTHMLPVSPQGSPPWHGALCLLELTGPESSLQLAEAPPGPGAGDKACVRPLRRHRQPLGCIGPEPMAPPLPEFSQDPHFLVLPAGPPHCHAQVCLLLADPLTPTPKRQRFPERPCSLPHHPGAPVCRCMTWVHDPCAEPASSMPDPDRTSGVLVTLKPLGSWGPCPLPLLRAQRHTHNTPHPLRIRCPQLSKTRIYSSAAGSAGSRQGWGWGPGREWGRASRAGKAV